MAKKNTLDNFLELYGEKKEAGASIQTHMQDPSNPHVYDNVINKTIEYTGIDPSLGPNGTAIQVDPIQIRRFLNNWYTTIARQSRDYGENKLETLLGYMKDDPLFDIVFATRPHEIKNEKAHNAIVKIHKEFMKYQGVLNAYGQNEDPAAKNGALLHILKESLNIIDGYIEDNNKNRKDERKLNGKEKKLWKDSHIRQCNQVPDHAVGLYQVQTHKIHKKLKDSLNTRPRTIDYIKANVGKSNNDEKEHFYEAFYQTISDKKNRA